MVTLTVRPGQEEFDLSAVFTHRLRGNSRWIIEGFIQRSPCDHSSISGGSGKDCEPVCPACSRQSSVRIQRGVRLPSGTSSWMMVNRVQRLHKRFVQRAFQVHPRTPRLFGEPQ